MTCSINGSNTRTTQYEKRKRKEKKNEKAYEKGRRDGTRQTFLRMRIEKQ
jgi:hypothetical protein